jgi:hypothetical protein
MEAIALIREIGNEVCEGCDDSRDCGLDYDECDRIANAERLLDEYLSERSK